MTSTTIIIVISWLLWLYKEAADMRDVSRSNAGYSVHSKKSSDLFLFQLPLSLIFIRSEYSF